MRSNKFYKKLHYLFLDECLFGQEDRRCRPWGAVSEYELVRYAGDKRKKARA